MALSAPLIVLITFLSLTLVIGVSFFAYRKSRYRHHPKPPRYRHKQTLWTKMGNKLSMLERGRSVDTLNRKMVQLEETLHTLPRVKKVPLNDMNAYSTAQTRRYSLQDPSKMSSVRRFFYYISMMERNPMLTRQKPTKLDTTTHSSPFHLQYKQPTQTLPRIDIKRYMDYSSPLGNGYPQSMTLPASSPVSFLPNPNTHPTSYYTALKAKEGTTGSRVVPSMLKNTVTASDMLPPITSPLKSTFNESSFINEYKYEPDSSSKEAHDPLDNRMLLLDEETRKKYLNLGLRAPPPSIVLPSRLAPTTQTVDSPSTPLSRKPSSKRPTSEVSFRHFLEAGYKRRGSAPLTPISPLAPDSADTLCQKDASLQIPLVKNPSCIIPTRKNMPLHPTPGLSIITDAVPIPPQRSSSKPSSQAQSSGATPDLISGIDSALLLYPSAVY